MGIPRIKAIRWWSDQGPNRTKIEVFFFKSFFVENFWILFLGSSPLAMVVAPTSLQWYGSYDMISFVWIFWQLPTGDGCGCGWQWLPMTSLWWYQSYDMILLCDFFGAGCGWQWMSLASYDRSFVWIPLLKTFGTGTLWLWLAMAATCSRLFIHQKLPLDERAAPDYDDDGEHADARE